MRSILAAACAAWLSACASQPATPAFAPALYVARDADSTMYLYGTVHLRREGGDWGGDNAKAALAESEELWTEMSLGAESKARAQAVALQMGMSPERPLSTRLTPEEYARFADVTQRYNIPAANFEPMKPWLAALTLAVLPMLQAGYNPDAGIDEAINSAAGEGMRRRAFETAEQQIGFFANMSDDAQVEFLRDAIKEADDGVASLDELSAAWERGDVPTLERLVIDEFQAEAPEVFEIIFTQRNRAWTETLMQELEGSGVDFVAVGAGHLLGETGLVEALRARGVSVERVR